MVILRNLCRRVRCHLRWIAIVKAQKQVGGRVGRSPKESTTITQMIVLQANVRHEPNVCGQGSEQQGVSHADTTHECTHFRMFGRQTPDHANNYEL